MRAEVKSIPQKVKPDPMVRLSRAIEELAQASSTATGAAKDQVDASLKIIREVFLQQILFSLLERFFINNVKNKQERKLRKLNT